MSRSNIAVFFEVPSNLVLKRLRPSVFLPATMVLWAIFQTLMGLVTNYGQLLAMRFCLGMFEAGLFPGVNFYLNGWYRRSELSKRTAFFFGGAVMAGAFGGIFGYALGEMGGIGKLHGGPMLGWRWIFIIEGLLTFVIAVASFWMVHDWPDRAKFLTEFEREFVHYRLANDTGIAGGGQFKMKEVIRGIFDWKTILYMLCYIGCAECIYSQSLFVPSIVQQLGKWTTAQSLLLSVPPYAVAFITTMATAYLSDKFMKRGVFNMFWSTLGVVGYLILMTVPLKQVGARYFAVFLTTMAIAPLISNTITWCGNNIYGHYKKATAMGLVFSCGNSGGIVASLVYRDQDKPRYMPGHATALAFVAMNGITSVIIYFGLKAANKKREREYGLVEDNEKHNIDDPEYLNRWGLTGMERNDILNLGDDHPAFRYIL